VPASMFTPTGSTGRLAAVSPGRTVTAVNALIWRGPVDLARAGPASLPA